MALARIITRSHECSRELALDLLARGYTVEIVSPDKIPDNIADLELRVDAGPGDHLVASVQAHNGERSASLEFLHHLKSPMGDFIRRTPECTESFQFSEQPVNFNAEPSIEDLELPAEEVSLAFKVVDQADISPDLVHLVRHQPRSDHAEFGHAEVNPRLEFAELDFEESARLVSPEDTAPPEPRRHFDEETATVTHAVDAKVVEAEGVQPIHDKPTSETKLQWSNGPLQPLSRAILIFAAVLLLALAVGFGLRRSRKTSAQNPAAAPGEKAATAPAATALPVSAKPEQSPENDKGQITSATVAVTKTSKGNNDGHHDGRNDGLIARDSVTYLDKNFAPKPAKTQAAKKPVHAHSGASKPSNGGIAPNTVTYLNNNPTSQGPK